MNRKIAVLMGSDSDFEKMKDMIPVFRENNAGYEYRVISAHRTPLVATEFSQNAKTNGYDLIIAGAGMSAHLPGVLAAFTGVPVIGLPIKSTSSGMGGMDALHSIIQMPPGIPVATVGIDNAVGAAKLAVKMLNCSPGRKAAEAQGATAPDGGGGGGAAGAGGGGGDSARDSDCGGGLSSNDHAGFTVKIVYDEKDASATDLQKVTGVLDAYGIKYLLIDLSKEGTTENTHDCDIPDPEKLTGDPGLREGDGASLFLNLTGYNIEPVLNGDERTKGALLVEVPIKASTGGFNDTSDKIYLQTKNSESAAFVGVASYQNAAHLIARIAGIHDRSIYDKVVSEHAKLAAAVIEKDAKMRKEVSG